MLESLEKMLARGQDNALLRFGLGKGYLDAGEPLRALQHLARGVERLPSYSAARELLGKAHEGSGDLASAEAAWTQGLQAAQARGDKQAEKEMTVFLKRLARRAQS